MQWTRNTEAVEPMCGNLCSCGYVGESYLQGLVLVVFGTDEQNVEYPQVRVFDLDVGKDLKSLSDRNSAGWSC